MYAYTYVCVCVCKHLIVYFWLEFYERIYTAIRNIPTPILAVSL